jgi:hypothetical protein
MLSLRAIFAMEHFSSKLHCVTQAAELSTLNDVTYSLDGSAFKQPLEGLVNELRQSGLGF